MLRMNKTIRQNLQIKLHKMLDDGEFPEVEWHRGPTYEYDILAYTKVWGKMAHIVDSSLKAHGYLLGCYELRRADEFRNAVSQIVQSITPEMIAECNRMVGVPGTC
jgi:hypothetical protein